MKFTVYKNDIRDAIKLVAKCAAIKPMTPILSSVKITADNGKITLEATDFDLAAQAVIPANVEIDGAACVEARYLLEIVLKLPDDTVTFQPNDKFLEVTSGGAHFNLLTFDAADYPSPKFPTEKSFAIRSPILKKMIRQSVFAASKDDDRPIFKGVNFTLADNKIRAVATNTHRIAVFKTYINADCDSFNVVVPAPALRILEPYLSDEVSDNVTISADEKVFAVHVDNIFFSTRLIEGEFPPIERILDVEKTTTAEFLTVELKHAVDRVGLVAKTGDYHAVTLSLEPDCITLKAESETRGIVTESIEARCSDELDITFNFDYLADFLNAADAQTTLASFGGKFDPAKFVDKDDPNPEFVYVVTPVRT